MASVLAPLLSPAFLFLVVFQSVFALFQGDPGVGLYLAGGITFAFFAGLIPSLAGIILLAIIVRVRWIFFDTAKTIYWLAVGGIIGVAFAFLYFVSDLSNFDIQILLSVIANNLLTGVFAAWIFRHLLLKKLAGVL